MPIILFAELLLLNVSGANVQIAGDLSQVQVGEVITTDNLTLRGAVVNVTMLEVPERTTIYISPDDTLDGMIIEIGKTLPKPPIITNTEIPK